MKILNKYLTIFILLISPMLFFSCKDDELPEYGTSEEGPQISPDEYYLQFAVTLDKMGTTRAFDYEDAELEKWENYIDLTKFRVLFFDEEDNFLFESKSRWVKEEKGGADDGEHSTWIVSVPMFTGGNDSEEYDWDWDDIRKTLTSEKFKIALLVNVPDRIWNMGVFVRQQVNGSWQNTAEAIVDSKWFDNAGPYWTKDDTRYRADKPKTLFDLQHSQYDPIYDAKNYYNDGDKIPMGYYDPFAINVRGKDNINQPWMCAMQAWVDWGNNDDVRDDYKWELRNLVHPSADHPIAMYGVQLFDKIDGSQWLPGTPFTLGRSEIDGIERPDKAISLLRSVVKLELLVPTSVDLDFVCLFYPNIYCRVLPMDNWTPTNELWTDDHKIDGAFCREIDNIRNVALDKNNKGRICVSGDPNSSNWADWTPSKQTYQNRLSWFFGKWKEKGWPFTGVQKNYADNKSPSIFNTCIQRVSTAVLPENLWKKVTIGGTQYHYLIAYIGERNVNDPSNLGRIGNTGTGNPTLMYWLIGDKNRTANDFYPDNSTQPPRPTTQNIEYAIPIIDYSEPNSHKVRYTNRHANESNDDGTREKDFDYPVKGGTGPVNIMGSYLRAVMGHTQDNGKKALDTNVPYPLPLVRNHVYRVTIGSTRGNEDFSNWTISSEVKHSPTLTFPNALKKLSNSVSAPTAPAVKK